MNDYLNGVYDKITSAIHSEDQKDHPDEAKLTELRGLLEQFNSTCDQLDNTLSQIADVLGHPGGYGGLVG